MSDQITLNIIGQVHSCFKEKFGIPCQPGLVTQARASIEIFSPFDSPEAFTGIEQASHLWIHFIFHKAPSEQWRPTVRPPRLGGNKRMGVFTTRAPVRPNPLGLSVVKLEGINTDKGVSLEVSGIDLLDGSPVVDIKPYVPYVDCLSHATNDFADAPREKLQVIFSSEVEASIIKNTQPNIDLRLLIQQVLEQDPRPQYQKVDETRTYGTKLLDFELKWAYRSVGSLTIIEVVSLEPGESE